MAPRSQKPSYKRHAAPPRFTHGFGVAEAVELIRALGQLPSRLVLIGVEAGTLDAGRPLSPAVSARLNDAVQAALAAARVTAEPSPYS